MATQEQGREEWEQLFCAGLSAWLAAEPIARGLIDWRHDGEPLPEPAALPTAEREARLREAVAILRQAADLAGTSPADDRLARSLVALIDLSDRLRRYFPSVDPNISLVEIEALCRRLVASEEDRLGHDHPGLDEGLRRLAAVLEARQEEAVRIGHRNGDLAARAERLAVLERRVAVLAGTYGEHWRLLDALDDLATELERRHDRTAEAEPLRRRHLAIIETAARRSWEELKREGCPWQSSAGEPGPRARHMSLRRLANNLEDQERLAEAEAYLRQAVALDAAAPSTNPVGAAWELDYRLDLADLCQRQGRDEEAAEIYRAIQVADPNALYSPEFWAEAATLLAKHLEQQGDLAGAEATLRAAAARLAEPQRRPDEAERDWDARLAESRRILLNWGLVLAELRARRDPAAGETAFAAYAHWMTAGGVPLNPMLREMADYFPPPDGPAILSLARFYAGLLGRHELPAAAVMRRAKETWVAWRDKPAGEGDALETSTGGGSR